jgi:hypothetical protein
MMNNAATRRLICKAVGSLVLPLAAMGCQHTQTAGAQSSGGGHAVAQETRVAGHDVAQASRRTYHTVANGAREAGSSAVDIVTNSAVRVRNTPPESLSAPIIDVDVAMQARDWDQVPAVYASGATVAGPTGFLYEPKGAQSSWRYQVTEIPIFLVNTALLPYAFAKTPPWDPVEWKGATVEPTYTAVPLLPSE